MLFSLVVMLNARVTRLLAGISKISPSSVPSALRLDSPGFINGRSVGEWVSQPFTTPSKPREAQSYWSSVVDTSLTWHRLFFHNVKLTTYQKSHSCYHVYHWPSHFPFTSLNSPRNFRRWFPPNRQHVWRDGLPKLGFVGLLPPACPCLIFIVIMVYHFVGDWTVRLLVCRSLTWERKKSLPRRC